MKASATSDPGDKRFLLKEAVEIARRSYCWARMLWQREGGWNVLCKFFDNMGPIPHHMHQSDEYAALVGHKGKPEAYYFPPQYNQIENNFPYTFMGLEPGTTKDDVRRCLENWNQGDNGILYHSQAYRLDREQAGRSIPASCMPPARWSPMNRRSTAMSSPCSSPMVEGRIVDWSLLVKDVPPEYHHDLDYLIGMLDWDANVNPEFAKSNKDLPEAVREASRKWRPMAIGSCGSPTAPGHYSAKELTVLPGRTVTIKDAAAYGYSHAGPRLASASTEVEHAVHDPLRRDDRG